MTASGTQYSSTSRASTRVSLNDIPEHAHKILSKAADGPREVYDVEGPYHTNFKPTSEACISKEVKNSEGSYLGSLKLGATRPCRHGYGIQVYNNGTVYEGYWEDDKRQGDGRMIFQNSDYYQGDWKDGKYDGKGEMIKSDSSYKGEW